MELSTTDQRARENQMEESDNKIWGIGGATYWAQLNPMEGRESERPCDGGSGPQGCISGLLGQLAETQTNWGSIRFANNKFVRVSTNRS